MAESTNKPTSQTNIFVGGMNADTDDSLLQPNQYRIARNLRLTTNTQNSTGSLHNIEGCVQSTLYPSSIPGVILKTDCIRDIGIVIGRSSDKSSWHIDTFTYNANSDELITENTIRRIVDISGTIGDNLSTVTRYEDSDNIKLYIADGISPIRVVNIAKAIAYYDSVTTNKTLYTTENSISSYKSISLLSPTIVSYTSGMLKAGVIQFGYQLFDKNGVETEISSLTNLIPIYKYSTTSTNNITGVSKDYNAGVAIKLNIANLTSDFEYIKIISVYYDENNQSPKIYVIDNHKITTNDISSGYSFTCSTLDDPIDTYDTTEFNVITGSHIAPALIEAKNNYLFASNIKYNDEPFDIGSYDTRSYAYNSSGTCLFKDGTSLTNWSTTNTSDNSDNISNDLSAYKLPTEITQKYCRSYFGSGGSNIKLFYGGQGANIGYKFVVGELIEDYNAASSNSDLAYHKPKSDTISTIQLYNYYYDTDTATNVKYTSRVISMPVSVVGTSNYSNPYIASTMKSLQRDEIYRYGIVFFDANGNKSITSWIADIRTPSTLESGFETFSYANGNLYVRPLGIEFTVKELPAGAVSYQIVRCKRTYSDRATVTQGVLSTALTRPNNNICGLNSSYLTPSSILSMSALYENPMAHIDTSNNFVYNCNDITDSAGRISFSKKGYYNLYTPEYSYLKETYNNYLDDTSLSIFPISYVTNLKYDSGKCLLTTDMVSAANGILRANTYTGSSYTSLADVSYPFDYFESDPNVDSRGSSSQYTAVDPFLREQYDNNGQFCYTMAQRYGYNYAKLYNSSKQVRYRKWGSSETFNDLNLSTALLSSSINNISFSLEPGWNDYSTRNDNISSINSLEYNNWVRTGYGTGTNLWNELDEYTFQGPGGRSAIINTDFDIRYMYPGSTNSTIESNNTTFGSATFDPFDSGNTTNGSLYLSNSGTLICNIRKTVLPYGGCTKAQRSLSTYYPVSDILTTVASDGYYYVDTYLVAGTDTYYVPTFGGDIYICNYDFVKVHRWHSSSTNKCQWGGCVAYSVPIETAINLSLKQGPKLLNENNRDVQIEASNFNNEYTQDTPFYTYNSVYSQESNVKTNVAEGEFDEYNKTIDTRTYYSDAKTNDEITDSWCKFQPLNYIDVDSRYGPITNIRTFNNDLIYWQSTGVGKFSVNERSVISDDNTNAIAIGTGGILTRYDYLATVNGMREHEMNDTQSDNYLYWFDYYKNELCIYSNGDTACLSKKANVQNYLNTIKSANNYKDKTSAIYDKKYNEVLFSLSSSSGEVLVYSEINKAFVGAYFMPFTDGITFSNGTVLSQANSLFQMNRPSSVKGTSSNDTALNLKPYLKFIVNSNYNTIKVFDNQELSNTLDLELLKLTYSTDKITTETSIQNTSNNIYVTDREYSYRLAIPRYPHESITDKNIGNRYRGRSLTVSLEYTAYTQVSEDQIELSYITTTFRPSLS